MMFTKLTGDWGRFMNTLPNVRVLDLHFGRRTEGSYWDCMAEVSEMVTDALKTAQRDGLSYVAFLHGSSTSRPFCTTARSVVRGIMRSKESTPYIIKARSYQHENVFIAAIRPKPTLKRKEIPDYCTQNDGDCETCSLVNYQRDCMNRPISKGE